MAHDVFVSYSQQDKAVADAVVARLEQDGTRCWIAPRDIVPGTSWGDAIVDAIAASKVMILILSVDSSRSRQVIREVERAVSADVVVLPFRIENVDPTGAMAYFLGTEHWLDALTPPLERHIEQLSRSVTSLLTHAPAPEPAARIAPPPPPPVWWRRLPRGVLVIGGAAAVALLVFLGVTLTGGSDPAAATTSTTAAPTTTTLPGLPTSAPTTSTTFLDTTTIPTRYAYIYELQVGDCFDDRGTPLIPIVPCATQHDKEIFAVIDYPEGTYPENADTTSLCIAEFEPYVGIAFEQSVLALAKIVPSEEAWGQGERTIYCALAMMDGTPMTESAAGTAR